MQGAISSVITTSRKHTRICNSWLRSWLNNLFSVALYCSDEDQQVQNSYLQLRILVSWIGLYHVSVSLCSCISLAFYVSVKLSARISHIGCTSSSLWTEALVWSCITATSPWQDVSMPLQVPFAWQRLTDDPCRIKPSSQLKYASFRKVVSFPVKEPFKGIARGPQSLAIKNIAIR